MKLGIMQPYFLPYMGYVSLMKSVDRWIFMDEVQMIRHGWIERNRIQKQQGGWHYIRAPLAKHKHDTLIKDITIRNQEPWKDKILAQIVHYKRKAPYYYHVVKFLQDAFQEEFESITHQNAHLLKKICAYAGFDFNYDILSEMHIELEPINEPDEWSLAVCKALNIDHYINPILGKSFYNTSKYESAGVKINFLNKTTNPYDQKQESGDFIDGLSIIDVMMFNSPEEIMKMLEDYELE